MKIRCTSAVLHLALMMDFARLFISLFLDNITFQEIKRVYLYKELITREVNMT